jgi:intracellular sulfur oxidation DsrE/DsrF family protein
MTTATRRSFLGAAGIAAAAATPAIASAQTAAPANRALVQVTDNDPARWTIILNNSRNLREGVSPEPIEIEIVAYGPGILMLKADSPARDRVADLMTAGTKIVACQNTMNGMKLTPADMLPDVGYVPAGVVEVMRKQQQGWAYIRT